jgi:hypothetical protein
METRWNCFPVTRCGSRNLDPMDPAFDNLQTHETTNSRLSQVSRIPVATKPTGLKFDNEMFENTHAGFRIAILIIGVISLVAWLVNDRKRWI